MNRSIIDIHIVQSVPPSNINRDETGSPKTAEYGGVRRARVSSQAWKKATRSAFAATLDPADVGIRSKRIVELLADELVSRGFAPEAAVDRAAKVIQASGIKLTAPKARKGIEGTPAPEPGYLLFFSQAQVVALAELAGNTDDADLKKAVKTELSRNNSVDLALFGRMVADDAGLNVDAACQVAHAIGVHKVTPQFDYFTAVDDVKSSSQAEDAGAGMIGTVEFNSATLYRYATIDLDRLTENLGERDTAIAAALAFVRAFVTSMPTGKQNTFANRTLPAFVAISVRPDQPVNLVGAFEEPVPVGPGYVATAVRRLVAHADTMARAFDLPAAASWSVQPDPEGPMIGERATFNELLELLKQRLGPTS